MKRAGILCFAYLSGCAIAPDQINAQYEHVSHPLVGVPFGPSTEEDSLNHVEVVARWERGSLYTELGLGYKLDRGDGGFYGPDLVGSCRVGVKLYSR